jgi:very-short-patch-repair endonuclease
MSNQRCSAPPPEPSGSSTPTRSAGSSTSLRPGAGPQGGRTDDIIEQLAACQHGAMTREQLIDAGVSRHTIARRTRRNSLRRIHAGVYGTGPIVPPLQWAMAAVLACDGVLSCRSASNVWCMTPRIADSLDVIVARAHRRRRPGINVRCVLLPSDEITHVEGIPLTTPARTILDLAGAVTPRELERAFAFAEREGLASSSAVLELVHRHPGVRGSGRLRTLLAAGEGAAFTRSEAEERLLRLVRSGGLPAPEMNVVVHGREVDCYWRQAGLVVEVDGYAFHGSARAFVRDRQRDSALAAAGLRVLRLSWHQVTAERDRTLVQLAQALARTTR